MSFCHFKLTITNLLVLGVVAALFLSLFSGLLISAQAQQDTLDPACFRLPEKGVQLPLPRLTLPALR